MKKGLVNEDNYKDDVTFIYCATVEKHIKAGGEKKKQKKKTLWQLFVFNL